MDRNLKLVKGQKVIIRYINDRIRYIEDKTIKNIDEWTTEGEIIKIGRKYVTVKIDEYMKEQFSIEDDYTQKVNIGSPDYKIYLSKVEIINEEKAEKIYQEISRYFSGYCNNNKFSLNQLEMILSIIRRER